MVLLDNGIGVQIKEWKVTELQATGFCRVYYIISGDITYSDSYTTCKLKKGNMYVFPECKPYKMVHNPEKPIECLWFHIDFFPYSVEKMLEFEVDSKKDPTLFHTVNALMNEGKLFKENDNLYLSLTESLYLQIIKNPNVKKADTAFAEVLNYIRQNLYSANLNVISISSHFGYTTSHFIRLFKANMNTTPHRYITLLRMSAAAKLLNEGNSVLETAALSGYSDVKTFARVFKKNYGVPPSEYYKYYHPRA